MFDYLVVGNGLIGSAAGRSLSQISDRVALLGPDEPADFASHDGVFASHYDQGRITRILDADWIWGTLAKRSMQRYATLEAESGIPFHHPVGALRVGHNTPDRLDYITRNITVGQTLQAPFQEYRQPDLARAFPFFSFADDAIGLYETGGAGFINPRRLIQAQLHIAQNQGATILREIAKDIEIQGDRCCVSTREGHCYEARKVLITTGAFTNFFALLGRSLALKPVAESILLAELSDESLRTLETMPSVMYQVPTCDGFIPVYAVPPVQYPDGRTYLKIGAGNQRDLIFESLDQITTWFQQGPDAATHDHLRDLLQTIMPDLDIRSTQTMPCVLTYTATTYPYIAPVEPHKVFVAVGGCGYAGKSSVELGHIAAQLAIHDEWVDELPQDAFGKL